MKNRNYIVLLFPAVFFLFAATGVMGQSTGGMNTARGSIGKRETAPAGPMYMGNGGSNIRLAVLAPEVQGDVPAYFPIYIQGLLNNNIKKFSAINLIDRQNLNSIIAEQNIAANGRFSDRDFVSIGNLTNAQYFLFGTVQKLSGNRYSLQLSVTEASTGVRKASSMKNGTSAQFEENGTILNEATAELLEQLGIQLTAAGKQTLLAGSTVTALAEAGLAKGITAQAAGAEVRALFNYAQAVSFDPSQLEALSRLNTLSTGISGGTVSQRIINDIQARDKWLEVFKETTKFYNEHPPFEIVFDPSLIQIGEIDYVKRTANLGMRIALDPSTAGFSALNTLVEGLEKTGRRSQWGFSNWPLTDIAPKTAGTVLFNGKQTFSCKVEVSLLNEKNKTISKSSITLNTQKMLLSYDAKISVPDTVIGTVNFPNIKADDLTPSLTIVITAVNGIQARNLNASGYMKIETGDLEKRISEREAAAALQREQEAAAARQREQEAATRVYRIGDIGPAGGIIFYDKGNNSGGWRYLEAAPASTEKKDSDLLFLGMDRSYAEITDRSVGSGLNNTRIYLDKLKKNNINGNTPPWYCDTLVCNGFSDWYLPSLDEVLMMYSNLKNNRSAGFQSGRYWTSNCYPIGSEYAGAAYFVNFSNGQVSTGSGSTQFVRACRRF